MKKILNKKKIMKEAVSLSIAVLLVLSSAVAMADTKQFEETGRTIGYTMTVENSTAAPGTTDHIVEVTGSYKEEIFRYIINLDYGPTQAIGDINVTEINLNGCVGQDPFLFSWGVFDYGDHGRVWVSVYYNSSVNGTGIPAGQGKLINIVLDVAPTAESQTIPIFANTTLANYYYTFSGAVDTEVIDGHLEVSTNQPPETPDQPEGPTSGAVGVEYTYTTNPVTDPNGDDVEYLFDWGDGNDSGWLSSPNASYAWSLAETYEVTVKARDVPDGAESGWSEPLSVEITDQQPELAVESIEGEKGVTVVVANDGNGDATGLDVNISISGGFIIIPGDYEYPDTLAAGESVEITMSVFGIGLGIFTEMPEITVIAECAEGSSAEDSVEAKIFLSKVTIQE